MPHSGFGLSANGRTISPLGVHVHMAFRSLSVPAGSCCPPAAAACPTSCPGQAWLMLSSAGLRPACAVRRDSWVSGAAPSGRRPRTPLLSAHQRAALWQAALHRARRGMLTNPASLPSPCFAWDYFLLLLCLRGRSGLNSLTFPVATLGISDS